MQAFNVYTWSQLDTVNSTFVFATKSLIRMHRLIVRLRDICVGFMYLKYE